MLPASKSLFLVLLIPPLLMGSLAFAATLALSRSTGGDALVSIRILTYWIREFRRFIFRRTPLLIAPYIVIVVCYALPGLTPGNVVDIANRLIPIQFALLVAVCAYYAGTYFSLQAPRFTARTVTVGAWSLMGAIIIVQCSAFLAAFTVTGPTYAYAPLYLLLATSLLVCVSVMALDRLRAAELEGDGEKRDVPDVVVVTGRPGFRRIVEFCKKRPSRWWAQAIVGYSERHPLRLYHISSFLEMTLLMVAAFGALAAGIWLLRGYPQLDIAVWILTLALVAVSLFRRVLKHRSPSDARLVDIIRLADLFERAFTPNLKVLAAGCVATGAILLCAYLVPFGDDRLQVLGMKSLYLVLSGCATISCLVTARFIIFSGVYAGISAVWALVPAGSVCIGSGIQLVGAFQQDSRAVQTGSAISLISIVALVALLVWTKTLTQRMTSAGSAPPPADPPNPEQDVRVRIVPPSVTSSQLAEILLHNSRRIPRYGLPRGIVVALLEAGYVTVNESNREELIVTDIGIRAATDPNRTMAEAAQRA